VTENQILALDAIHLIEAYAAKDYEHADAILKLWQGQHDKLATRGAIAVSGGARQRRGSGRASYESSAHTSVDLPFSS
jgi:hypothetical protein